MIVITGATGQFGRQVVEGLLKKLPGASVGVSVRHPEQAEHFKQRGIRVCQGDFEDPASLAEAFDGAEQILLVSGTAFGDEGVRQHSSAIAAGKNAGVKRIVYTSHQAAHPSSLFTPARIHAATEALLQSSGISFVSLRNGFYAESALFQLGSLKETRKIVLPADGPVSWTARADLAEAAVATLTRTSGFDGISPPLTNSQTLDFAGIATVASGILGGNVTREIVSDQEYLHNLLSRGIPQPLADGLGSLYKAARALEFDVVDPTLERLLGRKPLGMKDVLTDYLSQSKPASH